MMTWTMNLNKMMRNMMMKRDRLLMIVDGSNLAHRAYAKFANLATREGHHTGLIYGFFRILQGYLVRFKPTYLIVAFDTRKSKQSNFKLDMLASYKEHRKKLNLETDYIDFNYQVGVVKKLLKLMRVPFVWDSKGLGHEADDYIAWIAMHHPGKVLIISSDKDFCQLLDKRIKVFNPFKETLINEKTCASIMGYSPEECVDYLSLNGDKSDDIRGYRGMGPVKIRQFLDEFGSIQNFLDNPDATFKGIDRDALEISHQRNYKLIDLKYAQTIRPYDFPPIRYAKWDKIQTRKIAVYLRRFNLRSFMLKDFMKPFKQLKIWNQENLKR